MSIRADIHQLVQAARLVDTHEHLLEERTRLDPAAPRGQWSAARDFSVLLSHYACDDLASAGMPAGALARLADPAVAPRDKWARLAPYYDRVRHTGYLRAVRESLRALYGEEDLHGGNCESISERVSARIAPGYYRAILRDVARLHHCQVHSLEAQVFQETEYPDLLCQDLAFIGLSTEQRLDAIGALAGRTVGTLGDWHAVIDWCFATYGPRAIAAKNNGAYRRRLDYAPVAAHEVEALFARRVRAPDTLAPSEHKAIQDHLFHYCLERAREQGLPVKLHTGYYAGHSGMPLERVRHDAADLCRLLSRYPDMPFVIMHMTYPYQDEAIALAKQYPNAYVDLCWAWILNPAAAVRFVKEFLMAAPASKLLTFGGDYMPVELVPGHASMARQGLAQALAELVEEGWLAEREVPALVERLTTRNALDLFDYDGRLRNWARPPAPP